MSALSFKQQGNDAFSKGEYQLADICYTRAISKEADNPIFYTNRALARIRLERYDPCIDDCLRAIELEPKSMKAYYYLGQAQLALRHPNEALSSALRAYELALHTKSPSTANISSFILDAKKEKWEARERERLRRRAGLVVELEESITTGGKRAMGEIRDRQETGEIGAREARDEIEEVEAETRKKVEELRSVFALADPENAKRREVPDWMVDSITFQVMQDPVTTKLGHSYERSTIEQHLRHSPHDPLTREKLTLADLRPNLALREACDEFLKENGWAVDW